jgi:hypothetical protein
VFADKAAAEEMLNRAERHMELMEEMRSRRMTNLANHGTSPPSRILMRLREWTAYR